MLDSFAHVSSTVQKYFTSLSIEKKKVEADPLVLKNKYEHT